MANNPIIQLSLCFIACKSDADWLKRKGVIDMARADKQDFCVDFWTKAPAIEEAGVNLDHNQIWTIFDQDGEGSNELLDIKICKFDKFIANKHCLFVIFESENFSDRSWHQLKQKVRERSANSQDTIPIIKIRFKNTDYPFKPKRRDIVYRCIPSEEQPAVFDRKSKKTIHVILGDFIKEISNIYEQFYETPKLGFGVLLVSQQGNFMLTERQRGSGRGKYSTIGGMMPKLSKYPSETKIADALIQVARKQMHLPKDPFQVGPMLSCTSTVKDSSHLIDLTFLAVAKNEFKVELKSDTSYKSLAKTLHKDWFDFKTMLAFYKSGKLYDPVANAFEQFCVLSSLCGMTFGGKTVCLVPEEDSYPPQYKLEVNVSSNKKAKINIPNPPLLLSYLATCVKSLKASSPFFFEKRI